MRREQQHLLIFIANYINDNNQAPTLREMATALDCKGKCTADYCLRLLRASGYIKSNGKKRGLTIAKIPHAAHPAIHAALKRAMAWEWRINPAPPKKYYVKKGYPKTNPKLSEYHAKRREARRD